MQKQSLRILSMVVGGFCLSASLMNAADSTQHPTLNVQVQVERDTPMKLGQAVHARVVHPLYLDNQLVIPAGSELVGHVSALDPVAKSKRINARMSGDFTPLHEAQLHFDELTVPGGTKVEINSFTSAGGEQIVRFTSTGARHRQSLPKQLWGQLVGREKAAVQTFTAPRKMDRAKRMLYAELPYHPELLLAGTEYTADIASNVLAPTTAKSAPAPAEDIKSHVLLAAALTEPLSSKTALPGTKVTAVVTEPIFDARHNLKVPQGSVLLGEVTQAQPAGKWGRGGTLRFSFHELRFPAGFSQQVRGTASAVDANGNNNLVVDAEGGVKPGPKGIAAPLAMGLLASSTVGEDEASVLHTGGASNGFGLIGRVAALGLKSAVVGAAFGFYGTGRSVYSRFIAHGTDVEFPKNTRIEVTLDNRRLPTATSMR